MRWALPRDSGGYQVFDRSERSGTRPPLSPRQRQALATYAMTGDGRHSADLMGISYQTFKNHMRDARNRLGVTSTVDAFRALGWLVVR